MHPGGVGSTEFGHLVRRWRDRATPDAVGLPAGRRRRASGLRREELAGLAAISADYLTRLEQGRATSPSAQVVESLARALRLSDAERDLLFRVAGHVAPGAGVVRSRLTPSLQRVLDRLAGTPVCVYDASWTLVTANAPYDALMGETTTWHGLERNAVWRHLVGPGSRAVSSAEEQATLEALLVADLRVTASRYPDDPTLVRLIRDLSALSPRFVDLWGSSEPDLGRETARHKIIEHPTVGRITLDCDTMIVTGDDLRLMVYTAEPGTEDAERLALAIVLGTQAFA